jgi:hypothetical protein
MTGVLSIARRIHAATLYPTAQLRNVETEHIASAGIIREPVQVITALRSGSDISSGFQAITLIIRGAKILEQVKHDAL